MDIFYKKKKKKKNVVTIAQVKLNYLSQKGKRKILVASYLLVTWVDSKERIKKKKKQEEGYGDEATNYNDNKPYKNKALY